MPSPPTILHKFPADKEGRLKYIAKLGKRLISAVNKLYDMQLLVDGPATASLQSLNAYAKAIGAFEDAWRELPTIRATCGEEMLGPIRMAAMRRIEEILDESRIVPERSALHEMSVNVRYSLSFAAANELLGECLKIHRTMEPPENFQGFLPNFYPPGPPGPSVGVRA